MTAGASELQVRLSDGTSWKADTIGVEPDKDIAVLKIDAPAGQASGRSP